MFHVYVCYVNQYYIFFDMLNFRQHLFFIIGYKITEGVVIFSWCLIEVRLRTFIKIHLAMQITIMITKALILTALLNRTSCFWTQKYIVLLIIEYQRALYNLSLSKPGTVLDSFYYEPYPQPSRNEYLYTTF